MADFCKECSEYIFGEDSGDLKGLCSEKECVAVLCEGCGFILVDHEGKNVLGGHSGVHVEHTRLNKQARGAS